MELTVVSKPSDGGKVIRQPPGNPTANGSKYEAVDVVTLKAYPSAGYVFDNWTGDVDGIPTADLSQSVVSFKMVKSRVIAANFAQSDILYSVVAQTEPSGGGSVRFQPDQASDGYQVNQSVRVWATPRTDYVFSHWMGDLVGNENPTTLLVSDNKVITAIFNLTVIIYCSPSEGGSVALEPESSNGYAAGTEIAISAKANKGYRFVSWEGDMSGSDRSIRATVDAPKTITARFAEESTSRWWSWVVVGLAGLLGALILLRLAYARMNRGALDEPQYRDE